MEATKNATPKPSVVARKRVLVALTKFIPAANDKSYKLEKQVLVLPKMEKERKLVGRLVVVNSEERMATIQKKQKYPENLQRVSYKANHPRILTETLLVQILRYFRHTD